MKTRIRSNSAVIVALMIERGLSVKRGAIETGVNPVTFSAVINRDTNISYATATKLQSVFGIEAVTIDKPLSVAS